MGASIHCCTKEKDNGTEIISKREEESVKEKELEIVRAHYIQEYKLRFFLYLWNFYQKAAHLDQSMQL